MFFAEMEARIARVERTWDRQGDKVIPLCQMGGGEMVRVSEIAQEGPGGLPTGLGGHHEGRGHHVCGRGGSPHETDTLRGGATPARAGDSCPECADTGGEYTRRGEGRVWGVEEYHPTSTRTHPPPRAKKL